MSPKCRKLAEPIILSPMSVAFCGSGLEVRIGSGQGSGVPSVWSGCRRVAQQRASARCSPRGCSCCCFCSSAGSYCSEAQSVTRVNCNDLSSSLCPAGISKGKEREFAYISRGTSRMLFTMTLNVSRSQALFCKQNGFESNRTFMQIQENLFIIGSPNILTNL